MKLTRETSGESLFVNILLNSMREEYERESVRQHPTQLYVTGITTTSDSGPRKKSVSDISASVLV